jgi:hypothetical protein
LLFHTLFKDKVGDIISLQGHYIVDAHMPLCILDNHDGQNTDRVDSFFVGVDWSDLPNSTN